jgi:hypothetical protein
MTVVILGNYGDKFDQISDNGLQAIVRVLSAGQRLHKVKTKNNIGRTKSTVSQIVLVRTYWKHDIASMTLAYGIQTEIDQERM